MARHRHLVLALFTSIMVACSSTGAIPPDEAPDDDAGPGSDDDCGPCPAPGECREGVCWWPRADGACTRDEECDAGELCLGGECTADCHAAGTCACVDNDGCDNGFVCWLGECLPDRGADACVRDDDCADGDACVDGVCRGDDACDVDDPYLAGTWDVRSELRLHEALPGWLEGLLAAVAEPFRFLAGQSDELGFDIPIFGDLIEDVVRAWARDLLPGWARDLMGAIADLHDMLSTMRVQQRWALEGSEPGEYDGTATWTSFAFQYRGEWVEGSAEDILGVDVAASALHAQAACGVLYVDRHDVDAAMGAVVTWAIETIVGVVSGGEYDGIHGAIDGLGEAFCSGAAVAAEELSLELGGPEVYDVVFGICDVMLADRIDDALGAVDHAMLQVTVLRLQGRADITGADTLSNGHWAGTLGGRDFTGDFSARRR